MRKALVIAVALAGISALADLKPALASNPNVPKSCASDYRDCILTTPDVPFCAQMEISCRKFNSDRGFRDPSVPLPNQNGGSAVESKGDAKGGSKGGGSKPKPGAQRTANGGIVMVTPEGKEWIWNGKYNSNIVVINRAGYQETISVMQGDPDVSLTRVVNGVRYNVASPAYAAALAAEQEKANGSKKGVAKVHYHKPSGPIADGATATISRGRSAPVAGTATTPANVSPQKPSVLSKQKTTGTALGTTSAAKLKVQ